MKTIKRYANRKLYDTENSAYVTLDEIAQMVKDGVDFTIIDNKTKKDITSLTLAQILCEEEKKRSPFLPLQALQSLIRSGGDFVHRRLRAPLEDIWDRTAENALLESLQRVLDESLHKVDEQVRKVRDSMPQLVDAQKEITTLRARVRELEARVMELEAERREHLTRLEESEQEQA